MYLMGGLLAEEPLVEGGRGVDGVLPSEGRPGRGPLPEPGQGDLAPPLARARPLPAASHHCRPRRSRPPLRSRSAYLINLSRCSRTGGGEDTRLASQMPTRSPLNGSKEQPPKENKLGIGPCVTFERNLENLYDQY